MPTNSKSSKGPAISPADFFSKESEKTKMNWFLFEYAAEIEFSMKKSLRAKLKRKLISNKKIAQFCIHYSKGMRQEILDKLAGKTPHVSHSYKPIEDFFPSLNDKLVNDLLTLVAKAWDKQTANCVHCPTRCISEKDRRASMFDDPFYYE